MKSEKGVTLISLLTYIAVLLTVMVIIGRITSFFNKGLENIDSDNLASTQISKLNYCLLKETKTVKEGDNITTQINYMKKENNGYQFPNITEATTTDAKGQAIKFLESGNIISYVNEKIYYNKIKICDNIKEFEISYNSTNNSIQVDMKIENENFSQVYTLR